MFGSVPYRMSTTLSEMLEMCSLTTAASSSYCCIVFLKHFEPALRMGKGAIEITFIIIINFSVPCPLVLNSEPVRYKYLLHDKVLAPFQVLRHACAWGCCKYRWEKQATPPTGVLNERDLPFSFHQWHSYKKEENKIRLTEHQILP